MHKTKWWLLQLFADGGEGSASGGDGGAAAATVVSDADDGHQRLRELGVPESKIRKNKSYKASAKAVGAVPVEQSTTTAEAKQQPDTATNPTEASENAKRMTWDEIKADPEYAEHLNSMMRDRVKKAKEAESAMEKLAPALQQLAEIYSMDTTLIDYDELVENIGKHCQSYADKGLELGLEPNVVHKLEQFDVMQKDAKMQEHYGKLIRQGEELKKIFPNFDLQAELKNPVFMRMTAPGVGLMSVEDAYRAVHRKEIEQAAVAATAQRTAENISNAIRSGAKRPTENGVSSGAASVSTFNYKTASKAQREALKQRIRSAAARGEKLYPGQ